MAKNWKVGEAVLALRSNVKEDIIDVGRRFPLFTVLGAQVNQAGLDILLAMPDYMTARKVESLLKGDAQDSSDDEEGAPASEPATPAKPAAVPAAKPTTPAAVAKYNAETLAGKTPKELHAICVELGLTVETRQPSEIYMKAIKAHVQAEAKKAKAAPVAAPAADEWDDEPAPAKPAKAAAAKTTKEDDEWDI